MRRLGSILLGLVAVSSLVACSFDSALTISPEDLPDATVGRPYSAFITASDNSGTEVISFVARGELPPGLSIRFLGHNQAEISGTPTATGTYPFVIVADGHGMNFGHPHGERQYTLGVFAQVDALADAST
jgi:hypothetical protein